MINGPGKYNVKTGALWVTISSRGRARRSLGVCALSRR
jgi:hypothetical protein